MSTDCRRHRLDGLEPGNLLAFLALLGVLRALEEAAPAWLPKVAWSVDEPPVRPLSEPVRAGVRGDDRGYRGHRRDALGGAA